MIEGINIWQPMETAPRDATWVSVRMKDGTVHKAHYACDMSGEDQPPFRGWFIGAGPHSYNQIDEPIAWRGYEEIPNRISDTGAGENSGSTE